MSFRLARIQGLVLFLTSALATLGLCSGLTPPVGVLIGGLAAWLDFFVIKTLASAMLAKRPATAHLLPVAMMKSLVLVAVPAFALLLPATVVDGVSFAIGVTALPAAIVIDALTPTVADSRTGAI